MQRTMTASIFAVSRHSMLNIRPAMLARFLMAMALGMLVIGSARADTGDISRGEFLWQQCASCHALTADSGRLLGPHLEDVFGRKAAAVEGYRYSSSMERAGDDGLTWTAETLDRYIENPRALVSRTRMSFRGVRDPEDRAVLIAYLREFSASPRDIPESPPTAASNAHHVAPEVLEIVGDMTFGEYLASECTTCHQASGTDSGIPAITGWPQDLFVVAMHAYKDKVRPHPVMQMIAGRLTDEEIASLAVYFESLQD